MGGRSVIASGGDAQWSRWALCVALACLSWVYRSTFLSIYEKWGSDAAYSHGYLLVPIALWLAWRKRRELLAIEWRPAWAGLVVLVFLTACWVVARGTGVLVLEQLAVITMVPAIVLAIAGWPMTKALMMPFLFLFFCVPFGRAVVPLLMEQSADFATWALQATGVPVLRRHMYIDIPGGRFEVAKACSGLNFFVTGIVIGTLYAYLTYSGWKKRLLCVLAFILVPLLANGVRIYLTILVSHLTDMRYGPGQEHVWAGRLFFAAVMLVMFVVGQRWADRPQQRGSPHGGARPDAGLTRKANGILITLLFMTIFSGPMLLQSSNVRAGARLADTSKLVRFPPAAPDWQGPLGSEGRWRPGYTGGVSEQQSLYRKETSGDVDVFVAVYGLGATQGSEMISYSNVISPMELGSLPDSEMVRIELQSGARLPLRETKVRDASDERLVWHWYLVGERVTTNQLTAKAFEAMALLTGHADSERIVVLSTVLDADARARLRAFLLDHATCAAAGFTPEACGG